MSIFITISNNVKKDVTCKILRVGGGGVGGGGGLKSREFLEDRQSVSTECI